MIKHVLLAGAMLVAAPALAQTTQAAGNAAPGRTAMTPSTDTTQVQTAPQTAVPATPDTATPSATSPADQSAQTAAPATTGQPATATAQAAPAQAEAAQQQPATSGNQVAQIVETEFPNYDKDGDGKLSRTEFGAWMVALKTASDPSTKADAPATKTWIAGAFTQADKDKSASLSKTELTGFLSQGKS